MGQVSVTVRGLRGIPEGTGCKQSGMDAELVWEDCRELARRAKIRGR